MLSTIALYVLGILGLVSFAFFVITILVLFAWMVLDCLGISAEVESIIRTWLFGYDPRAKKEGRVRLKNYD